MDDLSDSRVRIEQEPRRERSPPDQPVESPLGRRNSTQSSFHAPSRANTFERRHGYDGSVIVRAQRGSLPSRISPTTHIRSPSPDPRERSRERRRDRSRTPSRHPSQDRSRERSRERRRDRSRARSRHRSRDRWRERSRDRSRERRRDRSRERRRDLSRDRSSHHRHHYLPDRSRERSGGQPSVYGPSRASTLEKRYGYDGAVRIQPRRDLSPRALLTESPLERRERAIPTPSGGYNSQRRLVTVNRPGNTGGYNREAYPAQFSDSESEDGYDDIGLAAYNTGDGASAGQSSLRATRLKAKLEAKLGEKEPATDPRLPLDYSPYANEKKATYDVVSSYFLGPDASPKVSAHIEYLATPFVPRQHSQPLFRWIHLTQKNMDFDHFTQCAQSIPGLTNDQIQGVLTISQRVRRDLEMPIRRGNETIGYCMSHGLCAKAERVKKADGLLPPTYVFCSVPYHKLAPYSRLKSTGNSPAGNSRLHPVLTLLQTKYPSITKQRDLRQAVRSVSGKSANDVFHVARLWFLIIDNKFIITSANGLSAPTILGEHSSLILIPSPRTQPSNTSIAPQVIQVLINNRIYVLPLSQCDSWFKFTQSFVHYTLYLDDRYIFKCRGSRVTAELWPLIVHQAKTDLLCVVISPRKRIITHGLSDGVAEGELDDSTLRPQPSNGDKLSDIPEADSTRSSDTHNDEPPLERVDSDNEGPRGERVESDKDEPPTTREIPRKEEPKPTGSSRNSSPQASHSRNPTSAHPVNLREFHILIWIALNYRKTKLADSNFNAADEQPGPTIPQVRIDEMPPKSDGDLVNDYLKFLHTWLGNQEKRKARTLYHKSAEKTLHDVELAMLEIVKSRVDPLEANSKSRLIQAVKSIIALFLPLDQNGIVCSKLWGALHMMVTPTTTDEYSWLFRTGETVERLVEAAQIANAIKAQLSAGNAPPPSKLTMPPNALRAWHELLLCLLFWSHPDIGLSRNHAANVLLLLQRTHLDILINPTAKELHKVEAVLPNGLVAIMVNRLVADFTDGQPSLVDTYWEYFSQLEVKLGNKLLSRRKQATIGAFIQELQIVQATLQDQSYIRWIFHVEIGKEEDAVNPTGRGPWPTDQGRSLLEATDMTLRKKIDVVEELLGKARELLESSAKEVLVQKDTQERLIYTFTIVTIIFLPLSTVATILGMNTVDVRNMENSQSLFWATALPLTAVVITVSLFVSGIVTWPFGTWPFRRGDTFEVEFDETETSDSYLDDD